MIHCPTFETERLVLKPRTSEHSEALQQYFNNWNIIKNLNDSVPWPYPDDGVETHYQDDVLPRIQAGQCLMWVICEKETPDHPIGLIEYRLNSNHPHEDRGFWLAEPFWGRGYMSEAVSVLNDYVFFDLGVSTIRFSNHKDNVASRKIKEKTGARFLNTKKQTHRGEEIEIEIWELSADSWKAFRKR